MGQQIEITSVVTVDNVALFETDRSITGQDGIGFDAIPEQVDTPPAQLAQRLFEAVADLERVYVASNQVTAKRSGDWDEDGLATARSVITDLFVFYAVG
ncbi:MAG: hypothetical protein HKN01_08155 [Acidimicrobiia bacterium]|nr:hypothetical protein [Acidimicrobiia bacterium]NNF69729.1 hypothetical protein [Acidimicrobiia bacterium]NNK91566.1 hypothetical protein [Acidimicrobiia bacterium]